MCDNAKDHRYLSTSASYISVNASPALTPQPNLLTNIQCAVIGALYHVGGEQPGGGTSSGRSHALRQDPRHLLAPALHRGVHLARGRINQSHAARSIVGMRDAHRLCTNAMNARDAREQLGTARWMLRAHMAIACGVCNNGGPPRASTLSERDDRAGHARAALEQAEAHETRCGKDGAAYGRARSPGPTRRPPPGRGRSCLRQWKRKQCN